eukprot:m.27053 g.27053  ORF g.27053 m.27053 type:complete len:71 (-) comp8894_c0_seq2:1696-1908(-)
MLRYEVLHFHLCSLLFYHLSNARFVLLGILVVFNFVFFFLFFALCSHDYCCSSWNSVVQTSHHTHHAVCS